MKFQRIIQAVYFEPWSITREGWQAVHAILKPHLSNSDLPHLPKPQAAGDEETDFFGEPLPKMEVTRDGVAIIPIFGTLLHHASVMDKQCGAVSYQDVRRDVEAALNYDGLEKIVFHIDSPGGMCMGCSETAAVIDRATEFTRTEAVTDGMICSAAYDLVAGVDAIYCTPSSVVGSIGAMAAWLDQSVRYEMAGLKVELFASGALKGTGTPGTSLTEEQRAYMQSRVDKYAEMFKSHVSACRMVDESHMHGGVFIGSDAVTVGLVDRIVQDVEERFSPPE
jgi:capsid assembly protease